ncbi:hypothetical protein J7E45_05975 [Microbacterium sp. ISL-59]|uniref:hypothetical protein n=1 Tax=Microbacterium sp. ISL-59 TaxID=2819159 RepID=UPI001BEAE079|nr:hypothetical protein [Microbacterium sp. ISL-59]MBT2495151.1 hypothetical protein [Microbacterium sp. ISL-59]
MKRTRLFLSVGTATALTVALSSCSMDTVIWGADGAGVIQTTEDLIDAAASGDADSYVCNGEEPELREPADWSGLSAEEPGDFVAEYWPDQALRDPDWTINLSLPEERVAGGEEFPGDVFYRETEDGLCLVDVVWSTVETEG